MGEVKELECILQAGPGREGHGLVRALCIRRASLDVRELSAEAFTDPEGAEIIGRILETAGEVGGKPECVSVKKCFNKEGTVNCETKNVWLGASLTRRRRG